MAVTAVPDERKGERLIVLHTRTDKTPEQMTRELARRRPAEPVDSLARQLFPGRRDSRAGHRQARFAGQSRRWQPSGCRRNGPIATARARAVPAPTTKPSPKCPDVRGRRDFLQTDSAVLHSAAGFAAPPPAVSTAFR